MNLGLLGAIAGAADYGAADIKDQEKRQRDMNDYEARAKFAQTLQEQLMERKLQLAQQYPTYTHFVTDSVTGDTRGYTPFGQVSTLSKGDPLQKQLYDATKTATANKNTADAEVAGARVGLLGAQTNLANVRAANVGNPKSKDKPMSAAAYKTDLMLRAHQIDPEAWAKPSFRDSLNPDFTKQQASRQQKAMDQAKAEFDAKGVHINEGLLIPQTQESNGNDFMQAGEMSDDDIMNY